MGLSLCLAWNMLDEGGFYGLQRFWIQRGEAIPCYGLDAQLPVLCSHMIELTVLSPSQAEMGVDNISRR